MVAHDIGTNLYRESSTRPDRGRKELDRNSACREWRADPSTSRTFAATETIFDVNLQIEAFREETKARARRMIPH